MYQTKITEKEAGQRFDKYLHRILPNAGNSFLYKMLRKKNITLNDRKADGSEKIASGDSVKIYFAEETLNKFRGLAGADDTNHAEHSIGFIQRQNDEATACLAAYRKISGVQILYENQHILLADKPAGVLSQKAEQTDISLNEWLIGYLFESGFMSKEDFSVYKPSVCNRLDRNTSGIVLCAKSLRGAQMLGELLKNRTLHKYYQTYVKGIVNKEQFIEGYLYKDEKHNKVSVTLTEMLQTADRGYQPHQTLSEIKGSYIRTAYKPLKVEEDKTLLEVELITGKPHQIRAHLAGIGHPLLGDYKYGDKAWNETYRQKYHVKSQLLHAYKVVFPQLAEPFTDISGRTFYADVPDIFHKVSEEY
ncbi:MAG: RluA family pseudouridine synthase [Lachnospiraceae bacterium]|nr:RluA family pseudouridine synthase [Lachnospiraceae bacterium]